MGMVGRPRQRLRATCVMSEHNDKGQMKCGTRDWLIYLGTVILAAVVFKITGLSEIMLVGIVPLAFLVIGVIAVWGDRRLRRLGGDKEDKGQME